MLTLVRIARGPLGAALLCSLALGCTHGSGPVGAPDPGWVAYWDAVDPPAMRRGRLISCEGRQPELLLEPIQRACDDPEPGDPHLRIHLPWDLQLPSTREQTFVSTPEERLAGDPLSFKPEGRVSALTDDYEVLVFAPDRRSLVGSYDAMFPDGPRISGHFQAVICEEHCRP